jgi:hypothetical protein
MKTFAAISVQHQAEKDLFYFDDLKNMKRSKTNQRPSRTICFASNTIKPAKQTSTDTDFFLRKVNLCG